MISLVKMKIVVSCMHGHPNNHDFIIGLYDF